MVLLIDPSDWIGQIITGLTTNVTGSIFFTMLFLIVFIVIITLALRFPVIFSAVIVFPIIVIGASIDGDLLAMFLLILVYMGLVIADTLARR